MVKATIANYLIDNLANRFPITQTSIIDHDIIDVMIDNWQHNRYPSLDFDIPEDVKKHSPQRLLM